MDKPMNRWKRIYHKLFRQKDRIGEYEALLKRALENGYRVMSLLEWVREDYPSGHVLLLRHDVDIDSRGAERMFEVERRLGVHASYYFRHLTMKSSLVKRMLREGFEVGLHYENLALKMRYLQLKDKKEISSEILLSCQQQLAGEIQEFRKSFGSMTSLCSHGAAWNRKLGVPNHILVDDTFKKEHDILFEAYDEALRERITTYISDASVTDASVWRYGKSPVEAIEQGDSVILLLTHPEHWNHHFLSNVHKLWLSFLDR